MPPHHHHHPSRTASTKALDRHAGHTPEMFRDRFLVSLLLTLPVLGGSLTFIFWIASNEPLSFALERAVTVVVIACPHALGLAIPLVVVNATAMAAQRGILIRNRESFERAAGLRYVDLDKTGTLTEGQFEVGAVYADGLGEQEALTLAAALEALFMSLSTVVVALNALLLRRARLGT